MERFILNFAINPRLSEFFPKHLENFESFRRIKRNWTSTFGVMICFHVSESFDKLSDP